MHELMELKKKLIRELEEYSQNGKFSKEDVETIKYMASAVDHLCNILMDEDGEYSNRGDGYSNRNDGMSRNYGGGSYARGRGRNARRDSMGRYSNEGYSRADGVEELVDNVRSMMQDLPQNLQMDAKRFIQKLEQEI